MSINCVSLPVRPSKRGADLVALALGRPAGYAMRSAVILRSRDHMRGHHLVSYRHEGPRSYQASQAGWLGVGRDPR